MERTQNRNEQPSPAKRAEARALGHAAALSALSKETPPANRSSEDEEYLRELLHEGHQLRAQARDAQPQRRAVNIDPEGVVLTPKNVAEQKERVLQGQNPDIVNND
ncbi:hypothetical protein HYW36_02845 [Candidatus Saccharibacteria bacterium]|nr:hypothetical protein [Candidatus Saccharibacteria bacterium]